MAEFPNACIYQLPIGSRMNVVASLNCVLKPVAPFSNPDPRYPLSICYRPLTVFPCSSLSFSLVKASVSRKLNVHSSVTSPSEKWVWLKLPKEMITVSATSVMLVVLGIFSLYSSKCPVALAAVDAPRSRTMQEESNVEDNVSRRDVEIVDDEDRRKEFETWKTKTFALTVPLRVVSLQGSVPPAWIKDFIQSQGKRLMLRVQFRGTLEDIFNELTGSLSKVDASAITADLITVGDSWLDLMISKSVIEPMQLAEEHDWFKGLPEKWKVYLHRNNKGEIDPDGKLWAVPYRWGSMVIAYKKSIFDKLGLAPIEDWKDLWRPELAGRIAMVDSPREVIGAVLKYMGASYNTSDFSEVPGGISAVQQNLAILAQQALLFDSRSYLKAFSVGDAWIVVGWSSDILPAAKRMSHVAVIAPRSGASLWADLWAIPTITKHQQMEELEGRVRGPSPLIHQWLEFCLQPARELPFKQGVFPGALPSALEDIPSEVLHKGAPKLVTNLISGIPPPEILCKCEFLEPLSEAALSDYNRLVSTMQKPGREWLPQFFGTVYEATRAKLLSLKKVEG